MKLTKKKLKRIINEELDDLNEQDIRNFILNFGMDYLKMSDNIKTDMIEITMNEKTILEFKMSGGRPGSVQFIEEKFVAEALYNVIDRLGDKR